MIDPLNGTEIAVVGLAGRFPRSKNVEEFWRNVRDGVECITFFAEDEALRHGVEESALRDPNFVRAAPLVDDVEMFDASFFDYSPREAELMDPQHRVFLECAYEALENAGYDPWTYPGSIGVYAGTAINTYLLFNTLRNQEFIDSFDQLQINIANDKDFLTTRVSYKLNLKGPSHLVQSACSTSLVAAHVACQSLLGGECDMALAGGVSINVNRRHGYRYLLGGMASPDGHCRAFDAKAQGTIFGSGVGVVVLKRLADALSDGDAIHAVVKGSAINNDGSLKVGYTAPSVDGQAEVITEALSNAGLSADAISYVEAHGTGTPLGDPIEIQALTKAYRAYTADKGFCAVGSVKSNVGHLDAAAGIAGLIKTVLALKHRQLPPTLHFERPNPQIDFANSPFYVNDRLREWRPRGSRLRAGVSAFGVGGTNAHLILEEAPEPEPSDAGREYQLLVVSARSRSALDVASRNLARHLREKAGENLADVAYTLQVGRRRMSHRKIVVCRDMAEAERLLESNEAQGMYAGEAEGESPRVVFMFPGQGSQYVNMGRQLYEKEVEFRKQVEWLSEELRGLSGVDLIKVMYPAAGKERGAEEELNETRITQPALFVVEYAMSKQLEKWGVRAEAMIGHSLGEYVAACLAGVMSVSDALRLVCRRGELMQEAPGGGMAAVMMSEAEATERIKEKRLSLAAVNGPRQVVISGEENEVEELMEELRKEGKMSKRLKTKHAFHSKMMEEMAWKYVEEVKKARLKRGEKEYISSVTGKAAREEEMRDAEYWGRQARECVRFGDGIAELTKNAGAILVEVGPGDALCRLVRQSERGVEERMAAPTMRKETEARNDCEYLTAGIGKLWMAGVDVDWKGYHQGERRRRVGLPTYPFERQRYWIETGSGAESAGVRKSRNRRKAGRKKDDVGDWFYLPGWHSKELLQRGRAIEEEENKKLYLVLEGDEDSLGRKLAERLKKETSEVIRVKTGRSYRRINEKEYEIRAEEKQDYQELLKDAAIDAADVIEILHLWSVGEEECRQESLQPEQKFKLWQRRGYYSLLFLSQAFAKLRFSNPIKINVISNGLHQVTGEEEIAPEKSTVLGFCKVMPQETPNFSCRSIDIVPPGPESWEELMLIDRLMMEIETDSPDVVIAYRGNRRWVQSFQPEYLERLNRPVRRLRVNGVYLITGGLGSVGLMIAEHLARTVQARLVLTGRSDFPDKCAWERWLAEHQKDNEVSVKIRRLQAMEAAGAEIMVARVDVADADKMHALVADILQRYGALHGLLHAAGITSGPSVFIPGKEMNIADIESQFRPKVYGLYVLERVLRDIEIDFCLLFSSNASVLGGLGLVAYSSANTFMDAFALSRSRANHAPRDQKSLPQSPHAAWISAIWDQWPEETKKYVGYQTALDQYAMTSEESLEAFDRVVTMAPEGRIVVSTGDLPERLNLWINSGAAKRRPDPTTESSFPPRPEIESLYVAPRNSAEQMIADIWQEILGLERVGVDDDFFILGGHSLLAIELIGKLQDAFQIEFPVGIFFQSPTVAGLAQAISDFQTERQDTEKNKLLNILSQLSDDDIKAEIEVQTIGF